MGQTNYFKLFCALGFIICACISCYATAESVHLLLPSWPTVFCWALTILFFVIASYGTKLIVDSFNRNVYCGKRGLKLIGGIIIALAFWLVCSFPTNTHSFFYWTVINNKVTSDIKTTQTYLAQIKNNTVTQDKIKAECLKLTNDVNAKLADLIFEIKNPANPNFGKEARARLDELRTLLQVDNTQLSELSTNGSSIQAREKLCEAYRAKVQSVLNSRLINLENSLSPDPQSRKQFTDDATNAFKNLEQTKQYINEGKLDLNNANDIRIVCGKLDAGYATIKNYKQFVAFNNEEDKKAYTTSNPVSKVQRMLSVWDVWSDFIKGEYAGQGFAFWIVISLLVDIAAFIFFDLAFKKQN